VPNRRPGKTVVTLIPPSGHENHLNHRQSIFSKEQVIMNAGKRGPLRGSVSIALALAAGVFVGVGGMAVARHDEEDSVKPISAWDIVEKLDGKETKVTVVEVTLKPGQGGEPHRHPGPVIGYVLEGEYELGMDQQPSKVFKAGQTFYEPTGCLHRVSKNPAAKGNTRVLAVVLHPRDAKQIAIPEK
jgi:quercetin dioxygenase-like cupin family protein